MQALRRRLDQALGGRGFVAEPLAAASAAPVLQERVDGLEAWLQDLSCERGDIATKADEALAAAQLSVELAREGEDAVQRRIAQLEANEAELRCRVKACPGRTEVVLLESNFSVAMEHLRKEVLAALDGTLADELAKASARGAEAVEQLAAEVHKLQASQQLLGEELTSKLQQAQQTLGAELQQCRGGAAREDADLAELAALRGAVAAATEQAASQAESLSTVQRRLGEVSATLGWCSDRRALEALKADVKSQFEERREQDSACRGELAADRRARAELAERLTSLDSRLEALAGTRLSSVEASIEELRFEVSALHEVLRGRPEQEGVGDKAVQDLRSEAAALGSELRRCSERLEEHAREVSVEMQVLAARCAEGAGASREAPRQAPSEDVGQEVALGCAELRALAQRLKEALVQELSQAAALALAPRPAVPVPPLGPRPPSRPASRPASAAQTGPALDCLEALADEESAGLLAPAPSSLGGEASGTAASAVAGVAPPPRGT